MRTANHLSNYFSTHTSHSCTASGTADGLLSAPAQTAGRAISQLSFGIEVPEAKDSTSPQAILYIFNHSPINKVFI